MKTLMILIPRYALTQEVADNCDQNIAAITSTASGQLITHIVVVDNGSSVPFDKKNVYKYLQWKENRGIAAAWNTAFKNGEDADFICWMNSDVTVQPGWDIALCQVAEQFDVIAMPYTNQQKSDGIGITGWCFLTRRDIALRIGPFDETFTPAYYEDTDWFHRALNEQIELVNVPKANVLHSRLGGGTKTAPWYARRNWLHLANRYRYAWKHGVPPEEIPPFWKAPLRDL